MDRLCDSGSVDRRAFLKAMAAAGSVAWLGEVGRALAQSPAPKGGYAHQVQFVDSPDRFTFAPANSPVFTVDPTQTLERQALVYPQSVASGDPQPNGIVLWTRVDPAQQGGAYPALVGWQIATDATFSSTSVLIEGIATLTPETDNTVKVPVSNVALAAYSGYYYPLCL